MFTCASVAMKSKQSRECFFFCLFFSGTVWSTTFNLSWLWNVRQSSTHVEVKTKLQHGQNKGVKHCWGSCFDRGGTWSTSLTSHVEIGGGWVARPSAVRSYTFVLALVWFLAVFNLQSSWGKKTRVKVTSLIYEHDYESPDATFPNKPQTFTANNQ